MTNKKFFSSGKVILSGEHSVVYGEPALVSAIDLGIEVSISDGNKDEQRDGYLQHILKTFEENYPDKNLDTTNLEISIESNLPRKSGLGSSAALAHAVFLSLLDRFNIKASKEEVFNLVLEAEKYVHGTPSGVDPSAVVFGGVQVFRNGKREEFIKNANLNFTLVSSGEPTETTGEMINIVKEKASRIIKEMGKITSKMIEGIKDKKFNPTLLTKNQRLLEELGVVGEKAKRIIKEIEGLGGFAKISGAGGVKNGSGWLLAHHPNKHMLNRFLVQNTMENHTIKVE